MCTLVHIKAVTMHPIALGFAQVDIVLFLKNPDSMLLCPPDCGRPCRHTEMHYAVCCLTELTLFVP